MDGWMDRKKHIWMVGWILNHRWMVRCIEKMDGWIEDNKMDGWI